MNISAMNWPATTVAEAIRSRRGKGCVHILPGDLGHGLEFGIDIAKVSR